MDSLEIIKINVLETVNKIKFWTKMEYVYVNNFSTDKMDFVCLLFVLLDNSMISLYRNVLKSVQDLMKSG